MATGGYNASFDETPTSFGSDSMDDGGQKSSGGGESSAPLVAVDSKR